MRHRALGALALLAALAGGVLAHVGGGGRGGFGGGYRGFGGGYRGFSGGGFRYGGYSAPRYSVGSFNSSLRAGYGARPGYVPTPRPVTPGRTAATWNANRGGDSFRFGEARNTTINSARVGWSPAVANRGWERPGVGVANARVANVNVNRTNVLARPAVRPPVAATAPFRLGGGAVNARAANINAVAARNLVNPARFYNRPWGRYYPWYRGGWRGWGYWPAFWGGWGGGYGIGFGLDSDLGYGSTIAYDNPYFVADTADLMAPVIIQASSTYTVPPPLDYSRPIQVPSAQEVSRTDDDLAKESKGLMDNAAAAFKAGDYARAMRQCDEAIKLLPGDTNLHEFRALVQFAQKRYKDAAGTLYAVLAAGPGWDWDTLSSFYATEEAYTRQLRALEAHVRDHPSDAAAHFVLAYHYLVLDQRPAARDQLAEVVKLQPKDKVSSGLLDALTKSLAGDKDRSE